MKLCVIGFSLCVFPVGGSPGFQSGGARLQACGKSASTRRASESVWQLPFRVRARFQPCRNCRQINKALAAGGLPFQLPHRLFSTALLSRSPPLFVFSPLVYPELRGATRLPCLPRACLPQAGFEGSEVEGPLFFVFSPLPTALHNRWPSAGFRREPVVFFQTMSPASGT